MLWVKAFPGRTPSIPTNRFKIFCLYTVQACHVLGGIYSPIQDTGQYRLIAALFDLVSERCCE